MILKALCRNALLGGFVFGATDIIEQTSKSNKIDSSRTITSAIFGTTFYGPAATFHFLKILPRASSMVVHSLSPKTTRQRFWVESFTKVFLAQFVYWSWSLNAGFITAHSINKHSGFGHIREDLEEKLMFIQRRNWMFWVPTAIICFTCIPVPHQFVYTSTMMIVWSCILTRLAHTQPKYSDRTILQRTLAHLS